MVRYCSSSPRNYHARKKTSDSQHPNPNAMYQAVREIVANPDASRPVVQPQYGQILPRTSDSKHPDTRAM
ncbi:hypothetical protein BDR03DRAFT_947948 [Suillus americanus]|nr:hypothetical protein BDR03DRAFT_947948 [Suillus americanus]